MRHEFSQKTLDVLAKRVGVRCSNPGCRKLTTGPRNDTSRIVCIGVGAHMTAASPGGCCPWPRSHPAITVLAGIRRARHGASAENSGVDQKHVGLLKGAGDDVAGLRDRALLTLGGVRSLPALRASCRSTSPRVARGAPLEEDKGRRHRKDRFIS
jgi:hypothetical protein